MKGSTLLKVAAILMIIGSAIGLIAVLVSIVAAVAAIAVAGALGIVLALALILSCAGVVVEFIAGIWGVKYCKTPEKAQKCVVMGIILVSIDVVSQLGNIVSGDGVSLLSIAIGLVIPVLYLVGAIQLKSNLTAEAAPEAEQPVE